LSEKKYWTSRKITAMTRTNTQSLGTNTMKKPTKTT